ncbi:MAG: 3-oxoacyl-[acyl-carrier-protein] reductase [Acidimicrobiales bacterium]|nr:3-oxoacyl-[acyl-carrier-protein] reductase [Acidimicrobiales bacterium]
MAAHAPSMPRRALVVGAARGIGRATAAHLAAAGHEVTATWHTTEPAPDPDGDHAGVAGVAWVRCDTTSATDVDRLFGTDEPGPAGPGAGYEIVVANAALVRDRLSSRMSDADFQAVVDVNLTGTFRVARAALAAMAPARWGRLVLVSSVGAWVGAAGQANYAATKTGLLGMARALAREAGPRGITVNVVAPGVIATELIEAMAPRLQERWTAQVPAGRMGTPSEVAAAIGFLCSDGAAFVTGALVPVDGGLVS